MRPLPDIHFRRVATNNIHLQVAECGEGPPVVLLHGFPTCWYSWRLQMPALAEAGLRAIAPDMRGYGGSEAPRRVRDYRVNELVADVAGLIEDVGGKCHLVGHDWGGVIAWMVAVRRPDLVEKLAILNAPPPPRYAEVLRRHPRQWLRSWYALCFQLPVLPELLLRAGDFALLERAWRSEPRRPGAITAEDIAAYKSALCSHGLTGPLNYYRAALRYPRDLYGGEQRVPCPTILLWGEHDPYLDIALAEHLDRCAADLRVVRLPDASHWVQHDAEEAVNRLLVEFFTRSPLAPREG